jgi:hypothetical protein
MNEKKKASVSTTTPLYSTSGPDGERVIFTPSDLVAGMGYLKSKKGKRFKPHHIKGHSLSTIVNNEGFGKPK